MKIAIVGLRRSGTTIFWESFRGDERLTLLNEPFNPVLRELPAELPNGSRAEFIEMLDRDPDAFWATFAPIARSEELQETLSDRQVHYLHYLLRNAGEHVAFDTTRCHFKLAALAEQLPDAVLVHLHRHPAAVASSHLIPSGSGGFRAGFGVRTRGRMGFWTRRDRYNNWGVEELVGRSPRGLFGRRVAEIGLDPERVLSMPAVAKLLAWWRIAFERAERDGPRHFGDRFVSIRFETFCSDPIGQVGRVYRALGEPPPDLDLSRVRPPNPPHRPDDPRWATWFRELAIDPG